MTLIFQDQEELYHEINNGNQFTMKRILLFFFILFTINTVFAQDFRQAVGIRAGWTGGFEYRVFTDDYNSYKFLFSSRDRGLQLHAMKEFHRYDLFDFTDQLTFVFGGGIHLGYERWDVRYYNYNTSYYRTRSALIAGLDALAGLEYTFYTVPISLGFEVKPYFDLWGRDIFDVNIFDFAFTAKYLF